MKDLAFINSKAAIGEVCVGVSYEERTISICRLQPAVKLVEKLVVKWERLCTMS